MPQHIVPLSREKLMRPALAGSILAKGHQISNVLSAVIVAQEIQDLLRKTDEHSNR
jgi:hypothetical protein